MGRSGEQRAVLMLSRTALREACPEELWLLDATHRAYFRRLRRGGGRSRTEDMLGSAWTSRCPP
ncbi:hypothetical protein AB0P17_17225 [Streptomyces sp. NPDC088124]|uniref:hypothetical protein n=1 Tax=Streptomyces sp. NPDC088124 TaxID=3154654 RepID=UPI00343BD020